MTLVNLHPTELYIIWKRLRDKALWAILVFRIWVIKFCVAARMTVGLTWNGFWEMPAGGWSFKSKMPPCSFCWYYLLVQSLLFYPHLQDLGWSAFYVHFLSSDISSSLSIWSEVDHDLQMDEKMWPFKSSPFFFDLRVSIILFLASLKDLTLKKTISTTCFSYNHRTTDRHVTIFWKLELVHPESCQSASPRWRFSETVFICWA